MQLPWEHALGLEVPRVLWIEISVSAVYQYTILNNISLNYLPEDVRIVMDIIQHKIMSSAVILISTQLYALAVNLPGKKNSTDTFI